MIQQWQPERGRDKSCNWISQEGSEESICFFLELPEYDMAQVRQFVFVCKIIS